MNEHGPPTEIAWQGNQSSRWKTRPSGICPPGIPHGLTWDRTWVSSVRYRRPPSWVTARNFVECRPEYMTLYLRQLMSLRNMQTTNIEVCGTPTGY